MNIKKSDCLIITIILSVNIVIQSLFYGFSNNKIYAYNSLTYGIDVSYYQGNIAWNSVKNSGIEFAIIRSGYGKYLKQKDPCFDSNYTNAKNAGVKCGTYWYSYALSVEDAILEADTCYSVIKGLSFDLPVYYDLEDKSLSSSLSKSQITQIGIAFCERIRSYGFKVGIYANQNWFKNYIDKNAMIERGYNIWLAQYPSGEYAVDPRGYDKSSECSIWQYSSLGKVNGINTNVDVDVAYFNFDNPVTIPSVEPNKTIIYYPPCDSSFESIEMALISIGEDGSKENRKKIAELNSITDYNYSAEDNIDMLNRLKAGLLIKEIIYNSQPIQTIPAETSSAGIITTVPDATKVNEISISTEKITPVFTTSVPETTVSSISIPTNTTVNMIYNSNGGKCQADFKKVYCGERVGSLITAVREDYEFIGWFDGNGKQITSDTIVTDITDFTVYAKWKEIERIYGDLNNDSNITIFDAVIMKLYFIGGLELDYKILKNADLNKDGAVNIADYILIKNIIIS